MPAGKHQDNTDKDERIVISPDEGEILDIELEEDFLRRNRELAAENRQLLDQHGIRAIDILGSVGAGKTSLIEAILERVPHLRDQILVIAGDVATTVDADRVARHQVRTLQINTGAECHLDARLIQRALEKVDLSCIKILLIENVGNLICPADFPLGSHQRVVVISVTEGPWVVQKHPLIFRDADLLVINKIDLAQAIGVDLDKLEQDARRINPNLPIIRTSIRQGIGVDQVIRHLNLAGTSVT